MLTCIVLACAFANGLELLRSCFISQWAGIAPPMLHFAMGWNYSAHVSFRNGLVLLRPCFVLLVLDGTFVSLFNVVLVARLDFFHLQSCWCSTGLLFLCLMSCWWLDSIFLSWGIGFSNPFIGGLDSPTHFEFCSGLDSPTHFVLLRPCFIILTDSSPVFSCLGQLRRILSSKPLTNRHSRRRRS